MATNTRWEPAKGTVFSGAWARSTARPAYITRTGFTASQSMSCARRLSYQALGRTPSAANRSLTGQVNRAAGYRMIEAAKAQLVSELGDAVRTDVRVRETVATENGALTITGTCPVLFTLNGVTTLVVFHALPSFGYVQTVAGAERYGSVTPPRGPSDEHAVSAALLAGLVGADWFRIVYYPLEGVTGYATETPWMRDDPDRTVGAEFVCETNDPEIVRMVSDDLDRVQLIRRAAATGVVAKRVIPGARAITKFASNGDGVWTDVEGNARVEWQCRYCPFQPECAASSGDVYEIEKDGNHGV